MWDKLHHFAAKIEHLAGHMDSRQWGLLAIVTVLVGFFCMKGHALHKG